MALGLSWCEFAARRGHEASCQASWKKGCPCPRWSLPVVMGQEWGFTGRSLTVTFCPGRRAQLTPLEHQVAVTNFCPEGEKWLCSIIYAFTMNQRALAALF